MRTQVGYPSQNNNSNMKCTTPPTTAVSLFRLESFIEVSTRMQVVNVLLSAILIPLTQGFVLPSKPTKWSAAVSHEVSSSSLLMTKNIAICLDGTGCDFSGDRQTNVARFYRSLVRSDSQLTYYDPGVGTLDNPGKLTQLARLKDRALDLMFRYSVEFQTKKAYKFLAHNWEPGDPIYLVGFSRGAYSARAVAGMIKHLGLVRPEIDHLVDMGWKFYAQFDYHAMQRFKDTFTRTTQVPVHFIGAWDTVSAFGTPTGYKTLPHTNENHIVRHIRHAVAIDEKRQYYTVDLFKRNKQSSFKQVWFAGVHGDLGGGFIDAESGLSKIALEWMCGEAADLGLEFNYRHMNKFLGYHKDKYQKPDEKQSIHNSMKGFYRFLEFFPRREWDEKGKRRTWIKPNTFVPRRIPNGSLFHESVKLKTEIKSDGESYCPPNLPDSAFETNLLVSSVWNRENIEIPPQKV